MSILQTLPISIPGSMSILCLQKYTWISMSILQILPISILGSMSILCLQKYTWMSMSILWISMVPTENILQVA